MRKVRLAALTLRNFRAYRDETTISFPGTPGLALFTGVNKETPSLGANGAGKSTIWDALVWCLTGASIKGQRANTLVTWGEKVPYVCAAFIVNDSEDDAAIHIERQGSPEKMFIDGKPATQAEINEFVGLSRDHLLQAVVFGQGVPLFADLDQPKRAALLSQLMNLTTWDQAAELAGKARQTHEASMRALDTDIARLTGMLDAFSESDQGLAASAAWKAEQTRRMDAMIAHVDAEETKERAVQQELSGVKAALAKLNNIRPTLGQLRAKQQELEAALRRLEEQGRGIHADILRCVKQIDFYKHSRVCETCAQVVNASFASTRIKALSQEQRNLTNTIQDSGIKQRSTQTMLDDVRADFEKLDRQINFQTARVADCNNRLHTSSQVLESLLAQAGRIMEETNPHAEVEAASLATKTALETELSLFQADRLDYEGKARAAIYWQGAFKRVRFFLIKQVLDHLTLEVENATASLGLVGWSIAFTTERELKSGDIKPGIHIMVTSPKAQGVWEGWSGGETQRLRLAITMGLSALIQRMAGVAYQFEVWDEPSAWLSPEGIESLLDTLKDRAEQHNMSVWMVDHRALIYSGFSEVWEVTKTLEGSSVALATRS